MLSAKITGSRVDFPEPVGDENTNFLTPFLSASTMGSRNLSTASSMKIIFGILKIEIVQIRSVEAQLAQEIEISLKALSAF